MGPFAQDEKTMNEVWSDEVDVLEKHVPDVKSLC